jgi:geranylgeranyl diphosphate synthase type II
MMTIAEQLSVLGCEIEAELEKSISELDFSLVPQLKALVCHSLFSPCKRLRPVLCIKAGLMCDGNREALLSLAVIPELLHTYSLIHDDLPCMDDADLRRGQLSAHKKFGEAMAVLGGDALLTFCWELLIRRARRFSLPEGTINELVLLMSQAVGINGMLGGQVLDMEGEGREISLTELQQIHSLKTGRLFIGCLQFAAHIAGAGQAEKLSLENYGQAFGHLFQITDDLLDLTSTETELGKPVGADQKNAKITYPSLLGVTKAREKAFGYAEQAVNALKDFKGKEAVFLRELVDYTLNRSR